MYFVDMYILYDSVSIVNAKIILFIFFIMKLSKTEKTILKVIGAIAITFTLFEGVNNINTVDPVVAELEAYSSRGLNCNIALLAPECQEK